MHLAEPLASSWKASLALGFIREESRTVLARRLHDGPLVVQKPLYPEGEEICHAIIVHPPGGIAGGDQLALAVDCAPQSHAVLTTPGAGKWYRSSGAWARQSLDFNVAGTLEWLPRETIVFDGALAELDMRVDLADSARFIGWEVVCLGRRGAGERFQRGRLKLALDVVRGGRTLFMEKGEIEGGGRLMRSPVGLGGRSVFGTLIATYEGPRLAVPELAMSQLPGLLVARYLGDSSEAALRAFTSVWKLLRPSAVEPRIWST
ncbi:MAG: urease accessory protein UreD [Betaproteobacteria bacterium]|nr:urease accessory protein UreD [Betaproteobacteria bacterium]